MEESGRSEETSSKGEPDVSEKQHQTINIPESKPELCESIVVKSDDTHLSVITETKPTRISKAPKEVDSDEPEEDTDSEDDNEDKNKEEVKQSESSTTEYDPANVHYEGEEAIYTDPKSGYQYKWCKDTNEWLPRAGATYGFEDDTHTYTDAEGVKFFWDKEKNAWFPKIDDDFMAKYQMSYGFVDNTTPAEEKEKKEEVEVKKEPPKKVEKSKDLKRKVPAPEPSKFCFILFLC